MFCSGVVVSVMSENGNCINIRLGKGGAVRLSKVAV